MLLHNMLANTASFTGNPPYSFPPHSSRYAAAHRSRYGRGEALIGGMAIPAGPTQTSLTAKTANCIETRQGDRELPLPGRVASANPQGLISKLIDTAAR
jgi:hypothetical protein